ncbi:FAD-dependent monooxygenase [Paenarthrobacter nitroguajacolicus]|uniref:FAD-dependent monooxygenase n=1 Tax=Paenarthrobacter nitroguajacolicus TaxID=211146 RepID=UPI00248BE265|nr:FAD-dependent monooxygenase [Paenarthrobacter nitroguajacolicus]
MRVLISGASIAGPALAHCLLGHGFDVTIVEKAPQLRPGGQAVDIRGPGKEVLRRIGLDQPVRAARTSSRGMSLVDKDNRERAQLRADMFDGDGPIAETESFAVTWRLSCMRPPGTALNTYSASKS